MLWSLIECRQSSQARDCILQNYFSDLDKPKTSISFDVITE
jgi:hypothetical protein